MRPKHYMTACCKIILDKNMAIKDKNGLRHMDKNNKLLELLKYESNELANSFEKAEIEGQGTPQEVADRREECFKAFLQKYFPFPYRIVKGNIIDSYGGTSQSIDCIVLNPAHPYTIDFNNTKASVIFADGVDYAIEIKPDLSSKSEIERALKQIQSVKRLRRKSTGIILEKRLTKDQIECAKTVPGIIYANKTYKDLDKLFDVIFEYYDANDVPQIEQFDLLFVNNRVLVYNIRPNSYEAYGEDEYLAFYECNREGLALFLYELNCIPQCRPRIGENIISAYLDGIRPKEVQTCQKIKNPKEG